MGVTGWRLIVAVCALVFPAAAGYCATADGTIITNTVSATYSTTFVPGPNSGYSVSYAATARVLAQDPCIDIKKYAEPSEGQIAGEVVTFRIWVINCSTTATTLNIKLYDQLPLNTYYESPSFGSDSGYWDNSYSLNGGGTWIAGEMPGIEASGQEWLSFALSNLGPLKSTWVSFKVTIL